MIKNERQYRITRAEAEKFAKLIAELRTKSAKARHELHHLQLDALMSQLADLQSEIREYENLRSGKEQLQESIALEELPRSLIRARIAAGLSQKELAAKLHLKEQQVQRYEATDYAGASVARMLQVANTLRMKVREDIFFDSNALAEVNVFQRLDDLGLERDFIFARLLPRSIAQRAKHKTATADPDVQFYATAVASHIYGWTPQALIGSEQLFIDQGVLGAARYKKAARAEQKRLSAYTFYAHFLSLLLVDLVQDMPIRRVSTDFRALRNELLKAQNEITFRSALDYVWDLGIPVLPLNDSGAFHGAMWRIAGRNVIVLKQQTASLARWLHDLLHELFHAGQEPELPERTVIEPSDTSADRINSDEEWDATQFAADIVLNGRAEELAKRCVEDSKTAPGRSGSVERLKSIVPAVAARQHVPADSLANYMAFRLSLQGINWWGAAQNLQEPGQDPWRIARDVLLQRVSLARIKGIDHELLLRALSDPEE